VLLSFSGIVRCFCDRAHCFCVSAQPMGGIARRFSGRPLWFPGSVHRWGACALSFSGPAHGYGGRRQERAERESQRAHTAFSWGRPQK